LPCEIDGWCEQSSAVHVVESGDVQIKDARFKWHFEVAVFKRILRNSEKNAIPVGEWWGWGADEAFLCFVVKVLSSKIHHRPTVHRRAS
jgi:hypothetical protein